MKKLWMVLITVVFAASMLAAQTKPDKQPTTGKTAGGTAAQSSKSADTGKTKSADSAKPSSAKIDINSASKGELEKLPGIGSVTSQKIIDGRPYKTKRDLLTRKIVGEKEYEKIKDNIIAHQDTAAAADKKGAAEKKAEKKPKK